MAAALASEQLTLFFQVGTLCLDQSDGTTISLHTVVLTRSMCYNRRLADYKVTPFRNPSLSHSNIGYVPPESRIIATLSTLHVR